MTTQGQGFLQVLYGMAGIAAAFAYGWACRRLNLRSLLVICMLMGTAANLGYLFYSSVANARVITAFEGWGFTLAELALMDLAVRATPAGSEGLGYSLMVSVRNLALFGTDWLGSAMLERYHLPFNALVLANSATTLMTVPLVFLLPRVLVRRKDAELWEEPAAPREAMQE
jgi:predicted MFS family arabinose efflux permease